jgi:hypothetical protein
MSEKLVVAGFAVHTLSTLSDIVGTALKAKEERNFQDYTDLTNFLKHGGILLSRAALFPTMIGTVRCIKKSLHKGVEDNTKGNLRLLGGIGAACSTLMLGQHLMGEIINDESEKHTELQNFVRMLRRNMMAYLGGGALLGSATYLSHNYHKFGVPKIFHYLTYLRRYPYKILV